MYYAKSVGNLSDVTWSHTCYNSGAIGIKLSSTFGFVLVCGGNDGDKSTPINNIYVVPANDPSSTSPYSNTPPTDAHC